MVCVGGASLRRMWRLFGLSVGGAARQDAVVQGYGRRVVGLQLGTKLDASLDVDGCGRVLGGACNEVLYTFVSCFKASAAGRATPTTSPSAKPCTHGLAPPSRTIVAATPELRNLF